MEITLFHGLFSSNKNNKKMEVETVQNPENKKSVSKEENADPKTAELDKQLEKTIQTYNDAYESLDASGQQLFRERQQAVCVIEEAAALINSIARSPKEFETELSEIEVQKKTFKNACDFVKNELAVAKKSAVGAGAGVAGGMAVASLAPSAAMWIATTFGTASTGTAISALSGAAATNAALAWLGGGALAAGGGGMTAGSAFLALAGPIGWGIGGVTLCTSVVLFATRKARMNKEKKKEIESVLKNTDKVKKMNEEVQVLTKETQNLYGNLRKQYRENKKYWGKDFTRISEKGQMQLGTLVNNTKSLAVLLNKKIGG